jgi:hypothetical protein
MPNFSPTEAAFEGFRFTRERPGAVAAWGGVTLLFSLASGLLAALIGGGSMVQLQASAGEHDGFMYLLGLLPHLLPAFFVAVVINLIGSAVVYASAVRSYMGIDQKVVFHLGEDERRIVLILLVFGLVYFVVSAIWGMCFGFLANVLGVIFPQLGDGIVALVPWESWRTFLTGVVLAIPPVAAIVRLSLAPVIAVDRKRINFKESWVSTKGHFWPLAGSLMLSIVLYLIVVFVALLVVMALAQVLSVTTHGAIGPGSLTGSHSTTLADFAKPAAIFAELLTAAMVAMLLPVIFGPLVRAYQAYDAPDAPPAPAPPVHA